MRESEAIASTRTETRERKKASTKDGATPIPGEGSCCCVARGTIGQAQQWPHSLLSALTGSPLGREESTEPETDDHAQTPHVPGHTGKNQEAQLGRPLSQALGHNEALVVGHSSAPDLPTSTPSTVDVMRVSHQAHGFTMGVVRVINPLTEVIRWEADLKVSKSVHRALSPEGVPTGRRRRQGCKV